MGESKYYVEVNIPDHFSPIFEEGGSWNLVGGYDYDLEKVLELYRRVKIFYVQARIMRRSLDTDVTSLVTA